MVMTNYIDLQGWYNPNRIHSKLVYVSPNKFEAGNHSQNKTKLNSVKCCKKSQLLVGFTNFVAAISCHTVSKFYDTVQYSSIPLFVLIFLITNQYCYSTLNHITS